MLRDAASATQTPQQPTCHAGVVCMETRTPRSTRNGRHHGRVEDPQIDVCIAPCPFSEVVCGRLQPLVATLGCAAACDGANN